MAQTVLKALIVLPFFVFATACSPETRTMDYAALSEFAAGYTAAWSSHDATRVAGHFSPEGSLKVNDAEPAVGRDAVAAVAEGFIVAFPDFLLEMDSLRVTDNTVEYHWTFSGTNTGPGGGGKSVRFSGYEEWTIGDDGLVATSLGHFDEAEYARQLQFGVGGD